MQPLLITDLDNTIYNWIDYFAMSFRGMVHAISRHLKVSEEDLILDFRNVYRQHGSVEYAFSIQELQICKNLDEKQIEDVVRIGKGTFNIVRDANLKPYQEVVKTLQWAVANKVIVIGVTNAPVFHAKMRLRQLHIDKYFYGIAGWEGHIIPDNTYTKLIREKNAANSYKTHIGKEWRLATEELKPNPFGYLRIIQDIGTSHKTTYVVGDSLTKDIHPALEIGATGIWAKYGTVFDKKNFETILSITHWDDKKVKDVYNTEAIIPDHTIDSFGQLVNIIVPQQISLF